MARPCRVCIHPSRSAIEQAILNGRPATATAVNFEFTYTKGNGDVVGDHKVITRHRDQCMPDAYARSLEKRDEETGSLVAERLRFLDEQVDHVIAEARKGTPLIAGDVPLLDEETGRPIYVYDHKLLLAAVRTGRANLELAAKLSGTVTDDKAKELEAQRRALEGSAEGRRLLQALAELDAQTDHDEARTD